jgi:hypothetical protein
MIKDKMKNWGNLIHHAVKGAVAARLMIKQRES